MKNKSILVSVVAAVGIVSQAFGAANTIYLTGSTAFRGNCYTVLSSKSPTGPWDANPDIATRQNGTASKSAYMLFHGFIGGTETYVSCFWSGSEAGIASVAGNSIDNDGSPLPGAPATFLKTDGTVAYTSPVTSAPTTAELESSSRNADLAMADTSKSVSLSSSFALHDFGKVGIATFTWVKNVQSTTPLAAWTRLSNVTHEQLRVQLGFPQVAAFFTGNTNDSGIHVYTVGRNKGSGTRVNVLADTGYGITKQVDQYSIGGLPYTGAGGAGSLTEVFNNGYESGGEVANALSVDGSQTTTDPFFLNTGYIAIGYLGIGDASGAALVNNWLSLNGVMESDGAVEEGQYSYWGNEHLYGANGVSGYKLTFGNSFLTLVGAQLGGSNPAAHSSGIQIQYMHAQKITDTAVPTRL